MQLGGKLGGPALLAQCAGALPTAAPLLFVRDTKTNHQFLIDTGAQVSVLPRRCLPKKSTLTPAPAGQQLVAANGSPITVYGTCLLDVTLSRHHSLKHRFFITDVTTPILGTDFLAAHQLVVDVASQRLLRDGTVCASAQRSRLCSIGVRLIHEQAAARYAAVLARYLERSPLGQSVVDFYYYASPPAARLIARSEIARSMARQALEPVAALAELATASSQGDWGKTRRMPPTP